jgi:hypothetical protein
MRALLPLLFVLWSSSPMAALKINITHQDIDRALTIARATDAERQRFHAPYIQEINTPFVERVEAVTELRRVVLLAEDHKGRGDRFFVYSATRAHAALEVFRRRVSIIARVRFHPLNTYVGAPAVTMTMPSNERALVGVKVDPIYALGSNEPGKPQFVPIAGAIVEGSFEAEAIGQDTREFVISLEGRELGRVTFDFSKID